MQKHSYLTTRPYNQHPIGSKCFAFRVDCGTKLLLEFVNGDVIELPGGEAYLKGLVTDPWLNETYHELLPLWEGESDDEIEESLQEMIMEFKRGNVSR